MADVRSESSFQEECQAIVHLLLADCCNDFSLSHLCASF